MNILAEIIKAISEALAEIESGILDVTCKPGEPMKVKAKVNKKAEKGMDE